jgi:hypothetical protein
MKSCPWCAGHGVDLRDSDWEPIPCPLCQGTGRVRGLDPALAHRIGLAVGLSLRGLLAGLLAALLGCSWPAPVLLGGLAVALSLTA